VVQRVNQIALICGEQAVGGDCEVVHGRRLFMVGIG
jgi:hypothetical protein